jgi:DNA (cytosine-5)-methyltransferase 1
VADLTVGSLFSGIGGLDLGLERAGMKVIWQSEIDPYCCRVLAKHWPNVPNLGDVTKVDWSSVERPDVICGGYPCQPFSLAGSRAGENDARHLWPHMVGAIRALRPRFAIMENVPGHLSLGFGRVLGDLAESGYDTEWDCIPAAAVGAPHRRDRVFVVAYAERADLRLEPVAVGGRSGTSFTRDDGAQRMVADTNRGRRGQRDALKRSVSIVDASGDVPNATHANRRSGCLGRVSTPFRGEGDDESRGSGWWSSEPDVGRVADGVPSRVDRLRGLGNAVVPAVAQFVGERIMEAISA